MNKHIKEIATQTRTYARVNCGNDDRNWHDIYNEKFAELIVRECITLNQEQLKAVPKEQKDWDGHNYGLTAAVYEFEDLATEHFGIKK